MYFRRRAQLLLATTPGAFTRRVVIMRSMPHSTHSTNRNRRQIVLLPNAVTPPMQQSMPAPENTTRMTAVVSYWRPVIPSWYQSGTGWRQAWMVHGLSRIILLLP